MSKKQLSIRERRLIRMVEALKERGGYPNAPNQRQQPVEQRVRALCWELERFQEMIAWDADQARDVMHGRRPFHRTMMTMRVHTGAYDGEKGEFLYEVDAWVQNRIDRTENTRN